MKKKMMMNKLSKVQTVSELIQRLKLYRPTENWEFKNLGIPLRFLGDGAFRETFEVPGLDIVVKIPFTNDGDANENRMHSLIEYAAYKKIKTYKKYLPIRRYLPEILYCSRKSGIMVVKKYRRMTYNNMSIKVTDMLTALICDLGLAKKWDLDIGTSNVGWKYIEKTGNGEWEDNRHPVILDLGLFE